MNSYPRKKHGERGRSARPPKRKFQGNQFSQKNSSEQCSSSNDNASARKLSSANLDSVVTTSSHLYKIVEFFCVFGTLAEILICKTCKKDIQFQETGDRGFGFKILVLCSCGRREINSGPLINTGFEINRRIVFVMRLLGIGREGINIFAGLMDLGLGVSRNTYDLIIRHIHSTVKSVFETVCLKAVREEKVCNVNNGRKEDQFKISADGSWKKRGFTSLYGVATLIGYYTGKVIDLTVKSSYCQACVYWKSKEGSDEYEKWYEKHESECCANHSGSAGKMEVDAIKEMFAASVKKYGVKYLNYIGDGDSKTYKAVADLNPYGSKYPVKKSECVGHVEKRMGTRLRNVQKSAKIGGRGKLTATLIKKLTTYYGLAIRRNSNSVEEMKKNIIATLDHLISTDKKPKHNNCPPGVDSWCKWRKAEAAGNLTEFKHPDPLHPDVIKNIRPIYEALSNEDLLTRCLGGHTQNSNESFNSTIWRLAPKHLNAGSKIIEIASFIAACVFNEGFSSTLKMMSDLNINIGSHALNFAKNYDEQRVSRQGRRSFESSKEARMARKEELLAQNEFYEEAEGLMYKAGTAD